MKILLFSRRHRCKHNPGAATKSQILPLEDHQGKPVGEVLTGQEKVIGKIVTEMRLQMVTVMIQIHIM